MKLLDSNVILYLVNGSLATPLPRDDYMVSVISRIEVLGYPGMNSAEENTIIDLLNDVTILPIDGEVADQAIALRRTTSLRLPDAIIAATAISAGVELLSLDRGFEGIKGLQLSAPALK